jgi:predicted alpha/beta-fold hydrolase
VRDTSELQAEAASTFAGAPEFLPRRFLRNGHLQTLVGNFLPRQYVLPEPETHIIQVDTGDGDAAYGDSLTAEWGAANRLTQARTDARSSGASYVLCHCHWQANASLRPTVLLVHGLEGSTRSQYMLGNSARAWAAGCNVIRMNMRNCGGTEDLSPTLYHSGLSDDIATGVPQACRASHSRNHRMRKMGARKMTPSVAAISNRKTQSFHVWRRCCCRWRVMSA